MRKKEKKNSKDFIVGLGKRIEKIFNLIYERKGAFLEWIQVKR
jgi:hypothetical protein